MTALQTYPSIVQQAWHPRSFVTGTVIGAAVGFMLGFLLHGLAGATVGVVMTGLAAGWLFNQMTRHRTLRNQVFVVVCVVTASVSLIALAVLLISIIYKGVPYLSWDFLRNVPSRRPERAGIGPAMWGTIWVCSVCALTALPLGVGTAVLLEEFRPRSTWLRKLHAFIQLNITNLAGVPSIVYGILGLTVFVQLFGTGVANDPFFTIGTRENWYYFQLPPGRGVLAGGLTLMLVILPIIIVASQEALRAVPDSLREGAFAAGATRWQVVRRMTLPAALPGIMTGSILAMSRAIGEAAPMLVIAGIVYITFTPQHLMDDFTVMPLQIYNWAGLPNAEFHKVAATGILVLLAVLLTFNTVAVLIRHVLQKPLQ